MGAHRGRDWPSQEGPAKAGPRATPVTFSSLSHLLGEHSVSPVKDGVRSPKLAWSLYH